MRCWGFEAAEAGSVAEAISAFDNEQPATVMLDINLTDGSGLDVLGNITWRVLADEAITALRGEAYYFIGKPIDLDEKELALAV